MKASVLALPVLEDEKGVELGDLVIGRSSDVSKQRLKSKSMLEHKKKL